MARITALESTNKDMKNKLTILTQENAKLLK